MEGLHELNDQVDFDYWRERMEKMYGDIQSMKTMMETYKKHQLNEQRNNGMTHGTRSSFIPSTGQPQPTSRHLSSLMDKVIASSSNQYQQQQIHDCNHLTSTYTDNPIAPSSNEHASSTPRRPLDESNSPEYQQQRRTKRSRPHEPTPTNYITKDNPPATATDRQFRFSPSQLKHAISSKLPCFFINFNFNFSPDNERAQCQQLPSAMKVALWIRKLIQQQAEQPLGDFSLLVPAGKNRYKVGVTSKKDFLLLWNCKWPRDMDNISIEVERPRSLPDCCAAVLRYVSADLSSEFIMKELLKSLKSVVQLTKINYHRPRSTVDYRFCMMDEDEYEEVLSIGRLAIGHVLLPITAFIPGLKMTYCNNCWELGHIRFQCKVSPRCRICLGQWNRDHICQKDVVCAQCQGPHASLSMECPVVINYRRTLKEEVGNAVKAGWLHQAKDNNKGGTNKISDADYPTLKQTNRPNVDWVGAQGVPAAPGTQAITNKLQVYQDGDQLGEIAIQMKMVVESTHRLEMKLDNQFMQMEILDKKSTLNKQAIVVLADIILQTVNTNLEKKNKQQLQKIIRQVEEFKDDYIGKFNSLLTAKDQQQQKQQQKLTSTLSSITTATTTSPSPPSNQTTTATTEIAINKNKGKNAPADEDQWMEMTDD